MIASRKSLWLTKIRYGAPASSTVIGSNGSRSASTERRPVSIRITIAVCVVRSGKRARLA